MFEYKFTLVVRELTSNEDLAIIHSVMLEREIEFDEFVADGKVNGRGIFMGTDADGHHLYQLLVKNSEIADYIRNQWQEVNSRFAEPFVIDIKVEPNS
jgi:hypothetical protein